MCNPNTDNAGHKTQNKIITQTTKISHTVPDAREWQDTRHVSGKQPEDPDIKATIVQAQV